MGSRWKIVGDGAIEWAVKEDSKALGHRDHIEMSGRRVSLILRYGVLEDGRLFLQRHVVWPMLRTIPNDTHASLSLDFTGDYLRSVQVDGQACPEEHPQTMVHQGWMTIQSTLGSDLELTRVIFPSLHEPATIELCTLTNKGSQPRHLLLNPVDEVHRTPPEKGVYGEYVLEAQLLGPKKSHLKPGKSVSFALVFTGRMADEKPLSLDAEKEWVARKDYVKSLKQKLRFECPDEALNGMFSMAKIRAAESIYKTKGGLMHGPGGGSYYAAIWANDQAEYANPFFAYLGDPDGRESAENAYRHFARFMNDEYRPIPSSIIAEGTDIWHGAGDRGDGAMIAYGAGRYALAKGDRKTAEELWPLISWCLEFNRRKKNDQGVIASDSDELEGRFPAGKANLCTSSLGYDALLSASMLSRDLGHPKEEEENLLAEAQVLREAIDRHFGATVEGFETYRYYEGNEVLRSWICIPMTMGILERSAGTIQALFSPRLWTEDGLATEAGSTTFWDRSTLYGLRGVLAAGETQKGLEYLEYYSRRRLLGDHVPYAVEAYPEGSQRHLSAESALYCRVITEGLFGFRPAGLRSFQCQPRLPEGWDRMALRDVHACGTVFDLVVSRDKKDILCAVEEAGRRVAEKVVVGSEPVVFSLGE